MRLKKQPYKSLPSVFLSNVRSLANKLDEGRLQVATEKTTRECCILLITETWLNPFIPNIYIYIYIHGINRLHGSPARQDRELKSEKRRGTVRVHE